MERDRQLINIRLSQKLWRKVKSQSALDGKTITQWVTEALEQKLPDNLGQRSENKENRGGKE